MSQAEDRLAEIMRLRSIAERVRALERALADILNSKPEDRSATAERKRLPVIDVGTCLGCYACVDVCPFDVLTVDRYVAVVARPEECCGVVLCEQVCPNGSLTIAVGEPVRDRPGVRRRPDVPMAKGQAGRGNRDTRRLLGRRLLR